VTLVWKSQILIPINDVAVGQYQGTRVVGAQLPLNAKQTSRQLGFGLAQFIKRKTTIISDTSLLCMERARSLNVSFALKDAKDSTSFHIGPANLVVGAYQTRGLVSCQGFGCPQVTPLPGTTEQIERYDLGAKKIYVGRGDPRFQSVLLDLARRTPSTIILRSHECLQCCFRTAIETDAHEQVFIDPSSGCQTY